MLIGMLANRTGFSRDTIRYYEKIGLIEKPRRPRAGSTYKDYPEETVQILLAIRKYKDLGFTLEEIRELLVLQSIRVLDVSKLLQLVVQKITGIDEEIERLHTLRLSLGREHQLLLHQKKGRVIELPELKMAA
jgi:MerR family transcriptional regulator, copper efflux regulator